MFIVYWLALLVLSASSLNTQERITNFTSDVTVNADATLQIQETIDVISTGSSIVHGIVREFPTSYKQYGLINYIVDFNIHSVTHNGDPAPFFVKSIKNGKKLYIGDKNVQIPRGKHTYTIAYSTNRQLGFFNNHDELYWNVTGNGWRLPIDEVRSSVQLPANIPSGSITAEGYTGLQSEQGKNYTDTIKNNRITFATTHRLQPRQGLTVAITWPKGFVHEPSWRQKAYWFFTNNLPLLWSLLTLLLLFVLLLYSAVVVRHKNKPGTVIPLFYPPVDFTPSMVGFMKAKKFNNPLLGADIVNLAVRGFITISFEPAKFLGNGTHTLTLVKDPKNNKHEHLTDYEIALLSTLFKIDTYPSSANTLELTYKNAARVNVALEKASKQCQEQTSHYIIKLNNILYLSYALCAMWVISYIFFYESIITLIIASLVVEAIRNYFYHAYTPQGRKIQDEIDGFELYLTTAEIARMNIIGTPPTRTPELYEKYLAYAIALGVEKQWTQQFASVFATLAQQGHAYVPIWYAGRSFEVNSFASDVGSSFNSAISSASSSPGSSSGSGGEGSSGGGGGGGGGGGW